VRQRGTHESSTGMETCPRKYKNSEDSLELAEYLKSWLGEGKIKAIDYKK